MDFDYEKETRDHYKSDSFAENYHDDFSSKRGIKAWRFRVVADRERQSVDRFLSRLSAQSVLDIPAGTGKLAPVFKARGLDVTACDISKNMLKVARREYESHGYNRVTFQVCDASKISDTLDRKFDVAVCLRLLHRVPDEVTSAALEQLARHAPNAIVSFGVESTFQNARALVRQRLLGGVPMDLCFRTIPEIHELLRPHFEVLDSVWVVPLMSRERLFFLKSKY